MNAPAPSTSLWRNRDFALLWTSQSLSDLGASISALAMPLLVLTYTRSPVQAGLVGTVGLIARLVSRLPAGVLADRVNRRRALIACDAFRLAALVGLAASVATGHAGITVILAVTVFDAGGSTVFSTVEHASLRSIVPASHLATAVARNEARTYAAGLAGPPLGGLLFGLAHALPFAGNALTSILSITGVALIRKPMQAVRDQPTSGHAAALTEGIHFTISHPFLRAVLLIAAPLNFALSGAIFAIIISLQRTGTEPAVIGLVETIAAVGGLAGALACPPLQRRLPLSTLSRMICWASIGLLALSAAFAGGIAMAFPLAAALFLGPACNAALFGHQAAITPDHLQGRVLSVIFLCANSASAASPILAGVLVAQWNGATALLLFAAAVGISAAAATMSRGIRTARPVTAPDAHVSR
ncbi:MFS transporter [Mangrovihabitans endophyticus]|uniref:Major Facilitator Superfamily protein n=1 Tax=Mangrovihabitans endophyticus TaxID=1751298 RepID=A0A8J3FK46_9ACTN|nr:MFS transporter [Mangrovihabitans endophyticus]GGK70824.1 hypothetical protein GCM10012284_00860 [Mangrovihabitans endophyticus]